MLFPLDENTPTCKVFKALNEELLFFLLQSVTEQTFSRGLFSRTIGQECWENVPTREKFCDLFDCLPELKDERQVIYETVARNQNIFTFFSDSSVLLPKLPSPELFKSFKSLTTHLFTRTKELVGIVRIVGESIEDHYQAYVRSNSELCFICGTSALSHNRFNIPDEDQWRSDYDHLLCKDKYPIYACHPDNFMPTCHICNSKAKGVKDILHDKNARRTAFYPLPPACQSFYQKAEVEPVFSELGDFIQDGLSNPLKFTRVKYRNPTPDELTMIKAWIDLYEVPKRVSERIISTFCEYIDGDCAPDDFEDFCYQVSRKSNRQPPDIMTTEWRFWWYRLYQWLDVQDEAVKKDAWELINWKRLQVEKNNDAAQTYRT